jgi:hypothetical protein
MRFEAAGLTVKVTDELRLCQCCMPSLIVTAPSGRAPRGQCRGALPGSVAVRLERGGALVGVLVLADSLGLFGA